MMTAAPHVPHSHRQIAHRGRTIALLCLVHGNLLNGLSHGWWIAKHNAHHAHPNDLEADPDVASVRSCSTLTRPARAEERPPG